MRNWEVINDKTGIGCKDDNGKRNRKYNPTAIKTDERGNKEAGYQGIKIFFYYICILMHIRGKAISI